MPWPTTSRHQRGYGSAWDKLRKQVLIRDKYLCQTCLKTGRVTEATEVDHIKPKAKDGTDDMSNLSAICSPCHKEKTLMEQGKAKPRAAIGIDGWPI